MNISRRWKGLLVLGAVWIAAAGCRFPARTKPRPRGKPTVYTESNPGPWEGVKISILPREGKVTVRVTNFEAKPTDYVRSFRLVDNRGKNVGSVTFAFGEVPQTTFLLSRDTRTVTVFVTATGRGTWRSRPRSVPPKPYSRSDPGPWQGVSTSITFGGGKVTVAVTGYPTSPQDYVRKIEVVDEQGKSLGDLGFLYGAEPRASFVLPEGVKEVTALVTSTRRGTWRSVSRLVPRE